ncbi:prohibitin family protein, partial [Pseudomonas aeruginosa]|nr:prohibitin family protein [Pseudomonas aeruginosa]
EIRAQALRSNPDVVTLNAVEKWDGKLPAYMASGSPLPFIGISK